MCVLNLSCLVLSYSTVPVGGLVLQGLYWERRKKEGKRIQERAVPDLAS